MVSYPGNVSLICHMEDEDNIQKNLHMENLLDLIAEDEWAVEGPGTSMCTAKQ